MRTRLALAISLLMIAPALAAPVKPAPKAAPAHPAGKWRYHSTADKMRGTVARFAELDSKNSLRFGFPYRGGRATLTLRDRAQDGLNVLLSVQGQFLCSSFSDSSVAVKFDNGPVEDYDCSEPDSGTTGLIFIENADKFVTRLRSARTVIIEANFFQEGPKQMEFDTAGLIWKQETKEAAARPTLSGAYVQYSLSIFRRSASDGTSSKR